MRIRLTSIFIDDQDRAESFYTEVLGLRVKSNMPYGDTERWLTVVSSEEPDGVELVLHVADEAARTFREANRQMGRPVLSLSTDDCTRDAEWLKAKGVVFVKEPSRMDYGGTDAVFDDTFGNLINLHRTKPRSWGRPTITPPEIASPPHRWASSATTRQRDVRPGQGGSAS
jgi:catechol 2,3-dioxygenase-like lactoylglutathione lyase family enzyme